MPVQGGIMRIEWRNSPEAREEMKRLSEAAGKDAPPLEWGRVIEFRRHDKPRPDDGDLPPGWKVLSPEENEAATARALEWLRGERERSERRRADL